MKHGTYAYRQGCRCDECRVAVARYANLRRRRIGGRTGARFTMPSGPVAEHLENLHSSGWTYAEVARTLGVNKYRVSRVRTKNKRIDAGFGRAILSLQPLVKDEAPDEVTVERLTKPGVHWRSIPCTREERLAALRIVEDRASRQRDTLRDQGWGDQEMTVEGANSVRRRLGFRNGLGNRTLN